jgi:hypothetical protein
MPGAPDAGQALGMKGRERHFAGSSRQPSSQLIGRKMIYAAATRPMLDFLFCATIQA